MKIWVHRYELNKKSLSALKVGPRKGALVKVEWALGQIGYSDLHPWPEFGEPDIETQLGCLEKVEMTPLIECSLQFNYTDREYRLQKRNAFAGLIIPRSHKLIPDVGSLNPQDLQDLQKQGFSHLKVKMGTNLKEESEELTQLSFASNLLWRIDFNGKLNEQVVEEWWKSLDDAVKSRIDFIEDPLSEGELKIPGPWANDWKRQAKARIRVLKPVREGEDELAQYDRVVFTHGIDHSLGQACAAWAASRFYAGHPKKMEVCGLASPGVYEPDDFVQMWNCEGPRMKPTQGFGFGFDDILESVGWDRIL